MGTLDGKGRFALLANAAWVDAVLAPEERALLDRRAKDLGVDPAAAREMIELARLRRLPFEVPPEALERTRLFDEVLAVQLADGKVLPAEEALLRRLGRTLGLASDLVEERLRRR